MPSSSASFSFRPSSVKSRTMKPMRGFLQRAGDADRMQKALLALGGLRRAGVFRQAIDDGGRDLDRVLHLALGEAGMGADALDGDGGAVGGEGLVLDIPGGFAVHRVGEIGAELFQVDLVDAAADLLVGREQDLDRAVLDLRIVDQELRRIHDLGEAGLVVGAEQRGAVGGDDVVADLVGERGMIGGADHLRGIGRQHDVAAAIILHDLRLDVLARCNRARCPCASRSRSPAPACRYWPGSSHRHSRARRDGRRRGPSPATRRRAGGRGSSAFRWRGRSARPGRTGCRSRHSAGSAR